MQPVYIIIGIPGAGKDTQGELLAQKLQLPRIDIGSTIAEFIKNRPDEYEKLISLYQGGATFPTEALVKILLDKLSQINYSRGVIINLKPNSIEEVDEVQNALNGIGLETKKVFYLKISREVAIERTIKRLGGQFTEKEPDIQKLIKRIDSFLEVFPTVLPYIKSKGWLVEIDGEQTVEKVFEKICEEVKISSESAV